MPHYAMLSNEKGDEGDLRRLIIFCLGTGRVSVYFLEGGEQLPLYQLFSFVLCSPFLFHCSFVYETIFVLTHDFYLFFFLPLFHLVVEGGQKERAAV